MRTIHTFILRTFIDPETPDQLRGSLQPVDRPEALAFADAGELLYMICDLVQCASHPDVAQPGSTSLSLAQKGDEK